MREIKFRAWDIKHHEMADVFQMSFYPSGLLYSINGRHSSEFDLLESACVLDKDGFEIFDRDVVEMRWRPIGKTEDRVRKFVVVHSEGGFKQLEVGETVPAKWYKWSEMSVIGNVYENKELCG